MEFLKVKEIEDRENFFDSYKKIWIWVLEAIYGYPRSKFDWPEFS